MITFIQQSNQQYSQDWNGQKNRLLHENVKNK